MEDRIVAGAIWINPERFSGAPCFVGTRLPIVRLFEWIAGGRSIHEFAEHWDVPTEHVLAVLHVAETGLATLLDAA